MIVLPSHKTKLVCTIGPACRSEEQLQGLVKAGMNVARLNLSHGDLEQHVRDIRAIREAARKLGSVVAILADLPGPKLRIGELTGGGIELRRSETVVLTTRDIVGDARCIPVPFDPLPDSVAPGSAVSLNDGFIQLEVEAVHKDEVHCRVVVGGRLLSHKGISLPGARLDVEAVTPADLKLIDFALEAGVDALSISFTRSETDILRVRDHLAQRGAHLCVIAKIERREAIENIDAIIENADGLMIARGDLGVEIPIEEVARVQKDLIRKANLAACPVITATQMLESMTEHIRPTRAEVTDVANAILDGTDAVMLSEETAIGAHPLEAVEMLARIARVTESPRGDLPVCTPLAETVRAMPRLSTEDVLSLDVIEAVRTLGVPLVIAPTLSGGTPRRIARYRGAAWIIAFCTDERVHKALSLSWGVCPVIMNEDLNDADLVGHLRSCALLDMGQRVIVARRLPHASLGKTNSLKIITLA